jgi:hypothetical protein
MRCNESRQNFKQAARFRLPRAAWLRRCFAPSGYRFERLRLKFVKRGPLLCTANLFAPVTHFGGKCAEPPGAPLPSCILATGGA